MFRTVPLSIVRSFSLYTQQRYMSYSLRAGSRRTVLILLASCMTYTVPLCTVKNSWWWTEKLSETCRVLFQKQIWEISASSWFYYRKIWPMREKWSAYRFVDSLSAGSGRSSVLILLTRCQQTCMTYTVAVCTVKNCWWWTEGLSETCRVLFQK